MFYLKDESFINYYKEETICWSEFQTYKEAKEEMQSRINVFLNSENKNGYDVNKNGSYLGEFSCELYNDDGNYHKFRICKGD